MSAISDGFLADAVTLIDSYRDLERRNKVLEESQVNASRFYNWAVSVEEIAKMHNVSKYIVQTYIKMGLIETHPNTTPARYLVRGSVALLLDFDQLREQAKYKR